MDAEQLGSSRYFVLAERLVYYQGAVRGSLEAELREQAATEQAAPLTAPPGQHQAAPVVSTSIASERLPTYTGEALAAMTDDGGMGLPGIEYDGETTVTHDQALPFVPDGVRRDFETTGG